MHMALNFIILILHHFDFASDFFINLFNYLDFKSNYLATFGEFQF